MAETKVKTTLEIGVDDKALKQLAKSLEASLSANATDAFTKSIERSTKEMTKLVDQTAKLIKLQDENARKQKTRDDQDRDRSRGGGRGRGQMWQTAVGTFLGNTMSHAAAMPGRAVNYAAQNAPIREGFISGMLSGIPYIGPVFGGAASAAQGYYADHVAQQQARARAFGGTGVGAYSRGMKQAGMRYGLGPSELPGVLQELAGASGVTGAGLGERLPFALRMQHMAGVGIGASGGFMEASSMLGSRSSQHEQQRTEEMLATGLAMGIREAHLGEFLQQMAGSLNQMHSRGIMLAPEALAGMAHGIGAATRGARSFRGAAGQQAALGLTQMTQGLGERESMLDMLAVQQAGYGQGGQGYWQSLMRLEENPNEVLSGLLGRVRGWGGDSEADRGARAATLYNSFRQAGGQLSRRQAYELAGLDSSQLSQFTGAGGADALQGFLSQRDADVGGTFGTPQSEAQYQYQRAGLGGRIGGNVRSIRRAEMEIVTDLLPSVSDFMGDFADEVLRLYRAFQNGGVRGLLGEVTGSDAAADTVLSAVPGTAQSQAAAEANLSDAQRAQQAADRTLAAGGTAADAARAAAAASQTGQHYSSEIESVLRNQIVSTILNSQLGTYVARAIVDNIGTAIRAYVMTYDFTGLMRSGGALRVLGPADATVGQ